MNKQAILIMAHNNEKIIKLLIKKLDSIYFDIFLHIDKKSNLNIEDFNNLTSKSNLYIYKEIDVNWAQYSQIECELFLLENALKINDYEYLHLISGVDFPLKKPEIIYKFFNDNYGKEFVHFQSLELPEHKAKRVVTDLNIKFYTGAQWFSITDSLARYILSKKEFIRKTFKDSFCPDEMVIQTIVYNCSFKDKLYNQDFDNNYDSIKRSIDWNRGSPYVWTNNDYNELINSSAFFARKFDQEKDLLIVERLYNDI